jgi:hypothetical protein
MRGMDGIELAQERDTWGVIVNEAMNIHVPYYADNPLKQSFNSKCYKNIICIGSSIQKAIEYVIQGNNGCLRHKMGYAVAQSIEALR